MQAASRGRKRTRIPDQALVPVLRVSDIQAASGWYRRLGFVIEYEHSSGPSLSRTMVILKRGEMGLILSNREEDGVFGGLVYIRVSDVEEIATEFNVDIKTSVVGPHIELRDLDGNCLRIVTPNLPLPSTRRT